MGSRKVQVEAKKRVEKLRKTIAHHAYLYHALDQPEISDEAYDSLMVELAELEERHPALKSPTSPTVRVGSAPIDAFRKVQHEVRQWSFDNVFTEGELLAWEERIKRVAKKEGLTTAFDYVSELKIDGLKIVLTYKKGELVRGATRGDGIMGEDVTENIKTVRSIPLVLMKPVDIVVGGELWLSKKAFKKVNDERKRADEPLFMNPRNAAAGTVRQLNSRIVSKRNLESFIYDIYLLGSGANRPSDQLGELTLLRELGFKVNPHFAYCTTLRDAHAFYQKFARQKEKMEFGVDGTVVKVNDLSLQEALGYTGKAPRYVIAFKFPAEQATTVVLDIVLQVGRTGVLTPVAHLRPTLVDGSMVSRATLHNEDEIRRLDVRIGDTVILQKAGDVIPDIVSIVKDLRTGKEKPYQFPKRVEACGGDGRIERVPGQVAYRCVNKKSFEQQKRRFHYFVGKHAFDIDGLGAKISDLLLEKGLITNFDDIFTLKRGDLEGLPGFKDKSISNLLRSIEKAKRVTLPRLLIALSIDHVGEETARDIAGHFGLLERIQKASVEELESIEGVGGIVAQSVYDWFRDPEHEALIKRLLKYVHIEEVKHTKRQEGVLSGKTVVITGTLPSLSRDEAKELVRKAGGHITSSVSKKTDYVLVGKDPGSKYDLAKKFGISIFTEAAFLKLIKF